MENKVKTTTISELEERIAGLINKSDSLPDTLYADENEQEKQLETYVRIKHFKVLPATARCWVASRLCMLVLTILFTPMPGFS